MRKEAIDCVCLACPPKLECNVKRKLMVDNIAFACVFNARKMDVRS